MPDLNAALRAAVEERLRRAKAAVKAAWCGCTFNDPAFTVRQCERDLAVLDRHVPFEAQTFDAVRGFIAEAQCLHCQLTSNDGDPFNREWPCPDVLDMAKAYGVETTNG